MYKVTITYIATDYTEHTVEATFSNIVFALTKTKATCMKNDVKEVRLITIRKGGV